MIGIDTVRISRIAKALEHDGFVAKCFTAREREYCDGKPEPVQSYAGIFCAKEAAAKALKCGLFTGVAPVDLEIDHDAIGAPVLVAHGNAARLISGFCAHVSVSHDGDCAVAVVMLEKER